jgi:receptor expression-enhancing protein 5/6
MSSTVNTNTTSASGNVPSPAQAIAFNAANLVKNKANYYLTRLDKELAKNQYANDIEKRTGVPKSYLVLGIATFAFSMIFMNFGAKLLTNILSWIYPGKC